MSEKIVFVNFCRSFSWPNQYNWAQSKVNNSNWGKTSSKEEKLQIDISGAQEKQVIGGFLLIKCFPIVKPNTFRFLKV